MKSVHNYINSVIFTASRVITPTDIYNRELLTAGDIEDIEQHGESRQVKYPIFWEECKPSTGGEYAVQVVLFGEVDQFKVSWGYAEYKIFSENGEEATAVASLTGKVYDWHPDTNPDFITADFDSIFKKSQEDMDSVMK